MSQIKIIVANEKYTCVSWYDTDTSTDGIDVFNQSGNHLGEIYGWEIPDKTDLQAIKHFRSYLSRWLTENNLI